jgi:hypothetical protein
MINRHIVTPVLLGVIHRQVGMLNQFFFIISMCGVNGDVDAGGDAQGVAGYFEGKVEGVADFSATSWASWSCFNEASNTTNSSPPIRATVSDWRTHCCMRCAKGTDLFRWAD